MQGFIHLAYFISCGFSHILHTLFHATFYKFCKIYFMRLQNLAQKILQGRGGHIAKISCHTSYLIYRNIGESARIIANQRITKSSNHANHPRARINENHRIIDQCESPNHKNWYTRTIYTRPTLWYTSNITKQN